MLIQLPPEVWLDILQWLIQHRSCVAEKFSQLADRQFSNLCQFWLHEYMKNVHMNSIFCMKYGPDPGDGVIPAQVPMPQNIVGFTGITIECLNFKGFNFVRRMSSLFTNICLDVGSEKEETKINNTLIVLDQLSPLIIGTSEVNLKGNRLFFERIRARLSPAILEKASYLELIVDRGLLPDDYAPLIANWLCTKLTETRMCRIENLYYAEENEWESEENPMSPEQITQFLTIIRQHFLSASFPTNFFFCYASTWLGSLSEVQESHIENDTTEEQLIVQKLIDENDEYLLVGRCSSSFNGHSWMQEMKQEIDEDYSDYRDQVISIYNPEIGKLDEEDPEAEEKGGNDDELPLSGPSSKKMKFI